MSSAPEYDSTPAEPLTPHQRYFNDVIRKSDSYADMLIATEKYFEKSGVGLTPDTTIELVNLTLKQLGYNPSLPDNQLRDIFTVLPFLVGGPVIDGTKRVEANRQWYEDALSFLRVAMSPEHTNDCLNSISFAFNNACAHGPVCPLVVVAKYLEADTFVTDFSGQEYDGDVLARHEITIGKEKLALRYGLRTQEQADRMIQFAQNNYQTYFYGPQQD